jgi:sugar lactone lactonase YvrE
MLRLSVVALAASTLLTTTSPTKADITTPPKARPESVTVAPDGSVILSSFTSPKIFRAAQGSSTATVFIDLSSETPKGIVLGVLADAASKTLWACQIDGGPGPNRKSALRGFDLATGTAKFRWDLPGESNFCNDIAYGPDRSLYVTDTFLGKVWRLRPGASEGELLVEDPALIGVDGVAFLSDQLYVNNVFAHNLFRIPIDASGKAGRPVDIWMDKSVKAPDGMRAAGDKLFVAESNKVHYLTINGDTASVTILKEGLDSPTGVQPFGDVIWIAERSGDKASTIPIPK